MNLLLQPLIFKVKRCLSGDKQKRSSTVELLHSAYNFLLSNFLSLSRSPKWPLFKRHRVDPHIVHVDDTGNVYNVFFKGNLNLNGHALYLKHRSKDNFEVHIAKMVHEDAN